MVRVKPLGLWDTPSLEAFLLYPFQEVIGSQIEVASYLHINQLDSNFLQEKPFLFSLLERHQVNTRAQES